MDSQTTPCTVAVTVWGQRVSPVFDSARTLLLAETAGPTIVGTTRLAFDPERPLELLRTLQERRVGVVICGAVSEQPAALLESAGIELIPFVAGNVHRVLKTFRRNRLAGPACRMPGCGRGICCRGKIRQGREIGARKAEWAAAAPTATERQPEPVTGGARLQCRQGKAAPDRDATPVPSTRQEE